MSTIFDFTYKINSETAQSQILSNVIAASAKKEYQPISHFFVDETKLAAILPANYATDAFGPVTGSLATKYRTTSKVRAIDANPVKVFAICDGQVLIQPQTGDNTKVNLIIKPFASYAPLKIKYFIYRGVNKADLIGNNILVPATDPNQPIFLKKLWDQYIAFNTGLKNPATGETLPAPTEFPSFLIGYDESQSEDILIENYFTREGITISHQIPMCKEGEHLGNFTGEIGLDIVLDYGDYQLQNQEELFKFDLKFARKSEQVFDTSTITNTVKIKRYKEYVHQFVDAAAFWGSHIEKGTIKTVESPVGIQNNTDIFPKIVSKYQTQNKIYIYIQGENVRSYNYYDAARKVYGFATAGKLNDTSGWPITIEEITLSTTTTTNKEGRSIQLEYSVASSIPEIERHVAIDVIAANDNSTSNYPLVIRPKNPTGTLPAVLTDKTPAATIIFPVNGTKSCATFLFLYANLKQETPLKKYYNDLFPVNLNTNFKLPTTGAEDMSYSITYDKSRLVNLDDTIDAGAIIQNKVVFDNGKGQPVGGVAPRKPRRLYMAILKRNSIHNQEYDNLNVDTVTANIIKETKTHDDYVLNNYNDKNFSVYKGTFTDGTTVNSLTLFHQKSLTRKNSFFHLGITEEEYNKLVYAQTTVPVVTPPAPIPQVLPLDADNVFFHLEEDTTFTHDFIKKYKLGLKYEDNLGLVSILFPTSATNNVFVYTLDGFYFFSKDFSLFQEFSENYPKTKADFRVKLPFSGEFGFDWMRDGTTGAKGDIDYKLNVGKLYSDSAHTIIEMDTNANAGHFQAKTNEYKKLELEYVSYPIQLSTSFEKYFIPTLMLYPPYLTPPVGRIDLDRQSVFSPPYEDSLNRVANLQIKIQNNTAPVKLELEYDKTAFSITSGTIPTTTGSHSHDIAITCLKEFAEEQIIRVVAFYGTGTSSKEITVGMLRILPNVKSKRFSKQLLFIDVITNINGTIVPLVYSFDQHAKNLKKFLRQISTTPIIKTETINLVLNPDAVFNASYIYTDPATTVKYLIGFDEGSTALVDVTNYLYDKLKLQNQVGTTTPIGDLYKDYFKVFFFHDSGGCLNSLGGYEGLSGYSNGADKLVDYPNNFPSTTTHEFLHTADVQHTFANVEGSPFAIHTFNPNKTDNILDYSDLLPSPHNFPTVSLFEWQGKIAQKNFDPEP